MAAEYKGQLVHQATLNPCGYQQITSLSAAKSLTVPGADAPNVALIQAETQSLRWRDDGVAPTASVGSLIAAGDSLLYDGDLSAIQLIETTASATANVSYYRR